MSEDDNSEDDNVWTDDFADDAGVIEDQEIYNMDTGWSIQDFEGIVQQPTETDINSQVCHVQSPAGVVGYLGLESIHMCEVAPHMMLDV